MAISITNPKVNPDRFPKGDHKITITYDGISDKDEAKIDVIVKIQNLNNPVYFLENGETKKIDRLHVYYTDKKPFKIESNIRIKSTPSQPSPARLRITGTNNRGDSSIKAVSIVYY